MDGLKGSSPEGEKPDSPKSNDQNIEPDVDEQELKAMQDAFVASSKRSHYVNIVIILASVLTFIAFWNSRQESWLVCRHRLAAYILANDVWLLNRTTANGDIKIQIEESDRGALWIYDKAGNKFGSPRLWTPALASTKYGILIDTVNPVSFPDSLARFDSGGAAQGWIEIHPFDISTQPQRDSLAYAVDLCRNRHIETEYSAQEYFREINRLRTRSILIVPVPFLGTSFDVNDLNIFAGFAFCVILLWFRFSLWRELTNLEQVFTFARTEQHQYTNYRVLAMQQVLTVPLILPKTKFKSRRKFWSNSANLLFTLPAFVQAAVIYHDIKTFKLGEMTNYLYALIALIFGSVFLAVIIVLTFQCWFHALDIEKLWDKEAEDIERRTKAKESRAV